MKRKIFIFLTILLTLSIIYCGSSWYIFSTAAKVYRVPLKDTLERKNIPFESIVFLSRAENESIILSGWYLNNEDSPGTIIIVHGIDSNRADPAIGLVDLAAELYLKGFSVLLFDLRYHGESESSYRPFSAGLFEQEDILGAYDYLIKRGTRPGKIGLLGFSLGASASLLAAAQERGISGVAADSPFADIRDIISSKIPDLFLPGVTIIAKIFYKIDINLIVPENAIKNLYYPALLIHCAEDERISPEHSKRLQAASPNSQLWLISCGNDEREHHAQGFKTFPDEYLEKVTDYFAQRFEYFNFIK